MKLSICIPTHHGRRAVLSAALDRIAAGAGELSRLGLQVVISDNASADGTDAMVAAFSARHPDLEVAYHRNARDIRLANIFRVVEHADGDWCWLFGSDDLLLRGALGRLEHAITEFPEASGFAFGKANIGPDESTRLNLDVSAFFPDPLDRRLIEGYDAIVGELAFQYAFLSTNVVRCDRWSAAARRVGPDVVDRHPDWPQLLVLADMAREDPAWAWLPEVFVAARSGQWYLTEGDGPQPDLARFHAVLADGLRRAWAEVARERPALRARLLDKSQACVAAVESVRLIKLDPDQTPARDARMLWSLGRAFWRVPAFRRTCVPLLLTPSAVVRRRVARRPSGTPAPDPVATRLDVTGVTATRTNELMRVGCAITNRGRHPLRTEHPYPVRIGARWADAATGQIVSDAGRLLLPRLVPAGSTVNVLGMIQTPAAPGRYELRVSPVQEMVAWFDDLDAANGSAHPVDLGA